MFLHIICHYGILQKCKHYCEYVIILLCFLFIIQFHKYFSITNKKPDVLTEKGMENHSSLSTPMIYQDRLRTLSGKCNHSPTTVNDIIKYAPASLIHIYPWLSSAIFPVEHQSLMYCAVPKVASKTLISVMIYVHVRDVIDYLNDNRTNADVDRTRAEKRINVPKLIEQLQKV